MKYNKTKSGRLVSAIIHEIDGIKDIQYILVGKNESNLKDMISNRIKKGLSKGHTITWNKNTDTEISIYRDKQYSDYPEEHSKYITFITKTVSKLRVIETNKVIKQNPSYIDNPECEFCYKKSAQLYEDHLLDKNKTKKMVCSKCRKTLKQMREILKKQTTKEVKNQND